MLLLIIDACGDRCAAALVLDGAVIAARAEAMARGHAERLMPIVAELLAGAGVAPVSIEGVAAVTGPGGFSGPRIGVAAARGLAVGIGRPAVGVSRFEAAAHGSTGRLRLLSTDGATALVQDFFDGEPLDSPRPAQQAEAGVALALPAGASAEAVAAVAARRLLAAAPRPAPLYARAPDAVPAVDRGAPA